MTKLNTGIYGCLGIGINDKALLLNYSDKIKSVLNLPNSSPIEIITIDDEIDPRPLYFIPYDPNIEQSEVEVQLCRRILYERFLGFVLCKTEPAIAPVEVVLTKEEVLNEVTFGLFDVWDDKETKKHFQGLWNDFMRNLWNILKAELQNYIEYQPGRGWVFKFDNEDLHEKVLTSIKRFKPESLDLGKEIEEEQLGLFET